MERSLALILLGTTLLLAGCQSTPRPTLTTEQIESQLNRVCEVFPAISYVFPGDTEQTVKEIQTYNAGRKAYGCP